MTQDQRRVYLIKELLAEKKNAKIVRIPTSAVQQKNLLRTLMNEREPAPISDEFLKIQDEYLKYAIAQKGITHINDLEPIEKEMYLWQGDITTLDCDAVVNAANSEMLGCFQPLHNCIDNCIHSAAGLDLRWSCQEIIRKQGHDEPTGTAKITPGFCLPAKYVLHTVGPIVDTELTDEHRELLRSSYRSCLDLAAENGLGNIAFCCISTGVFSFPAEEAAQIAVKTVRKWLDSHESSIKKVIFNVFGNRDKQIYEKTLG